jgi:hypothetical protein
MSHQPHNSLVRILIADGIPVGVGFLAAENLILTCAHFIAQGCVSDDSVSSDLSLLAPGESFSGRVLFRDDEQDVATIGPEKDLKILPCFCLCNCLQGMNNGL